MVDNENTVVEKDLVQTQATEQTSSAPSNAAANRAVPQHEVGALISGIRKDARELAETREKEGFSKGYEKAREELLKSAPKEPLEKNSSEIAPAVPDITAAVQNEIQRLQHAAQTQAIMTSLQTTLTKGAEKYGDKWQESVNKLTAISAELGKVSGTHGEEWTNAIALLPKGGEDVMHKLAEDPTRVRELNALIRGGDWQLASQKVAQWAEQAEFESKSKSAGSKTFVSPISRMSSSYVAGADMSTGNTEQTGFNDLVREYNSK